MENIKQQGSALIYTMVFLGIMVAGALYSVKYSSVQQKIAVSYKLNQAMFVAAENVLSQAEDCVKNKASCYDLYLFKANCHGGLCFNGTDRGDIQSCKTNNTEFWNDPSLNVWKHNSRHTEVKISSSHNPEITVKYIIEFICYVALPIEGVIPKPSNAYDWANLYRITVLASMEGLKNQVMLQSTYKR